MKSTFAEFYKLSDEQITELWQECLFVIDANVVLNLYRYPTNAREDLIKTLDKIKSRLWMPFQAALEYQRNRLEVIGDQKKAFDTVSNELNNVVAKVEDLFSARHPLISSGNLVSSMKDLVSSFTKNLEPLSAIQPAIYEDDKIRDSIDMLLSGRIGPEPTQEELDNICKEGAERYANKIPPGFRDIKKENVIIFRGRKYEAKFGDLVLWKQTLQKAKEQNCKSVIFISNDTKEDWWEIVSGKTIGPLPALRAEMNTVSGVEKFHIYTTEGFLELSKVHLHTEVRPDSIVQVAEVNEAVKADQDAKNIRVRLGGTLSSYVVEFDPDLTERSQIFVRRRIQGLLTSIFPEDVFKLYPSDAGLALLIKGDILSHELTAQLSEIEGVVLVRAMSQSWTKAFMDSPKTGFLNFEDLQRHSRQRVYDMFITLEEYDDKLALQTRNWIKVILSKELPRADTLIGKLYTFVDTSHGFHVSLHIALTFREAETVRRKISVLDGVSHVEMKFA